MKDLIIKEIQEGIEITSSPFKSTANKINLSENKLLGEIKNAMMNGTIKRFGSVVHHNKLGYKSNAMVVWDIPEEKIDEYGCKMSSYYFVRLCYQRPKVKDLWPYNLFCMIFGKTKDGIKKNVNILIEDLDISSIDKSILYTTKSYKQKGAKYR